MPASHAMPYTHLLLRLFWPSKTDFVRVAARFHAVVVPFGGIGADDNAQVLASLGELRQRAEGLLPFMARSEKRRGGGLMPVSESLAARHCLFRFCAEKEVTQVFSAKVEDNGLLHDISYI